MEGGETVLKTQNQVGIDDAPVARRRACALGSQESYYLYDRQGHQLTWVVRTPSEVELDPFRQSNVELALVLEPPLIMVCCRFGPGCPWLASAFQWHLVPPGARALPQSGPGRDTDVPLVMEIEEAHTREVLASRTITLVPEFARVLHEAILEQARFPYDPSEERRALNKIRSRCPIMGALVAYATVRAVATG